MEKNVFGEGNSEIFRFLIASFGGAGGKDVGISSSLAQAAGAQRLLSEALASL